MTIRFSFLLTSVFLGAIPATAAAQKTEYVTVQKVMDDRAIVVRGDGTSYLIEKGTGCLSLSRFEGRRIIVNSPGLFLGVGSSLILPDLNQQCRVWSADAIASTPRLPTQSSAAASLSSAQRLSIKAMMSATEFQAAGLSKLTAEELASLDQWVSSLASAALSLGQGAPSTPGVSSPATYAVQASAGDSKFVINGKVFEAQTFCFSVEKGDPVIFISGSAFGACAMAEFLNTRTSRTCKVWCK